MKSAMVIVLLCAVDLTDQLENLLYQVMVKYVECEACGEVMCPFIYSPICAQNAQFLWKIFNNQCELDSCGGASTYQVSCATTQTDPATCVC